MILSLGIFGGLILFILLLLSIYLIAIKYCIVQQNTSRMPFSSLLQSKFMAARQQHTDAIMNVGSDADNNNAAPVAAGKSIDKHKKKIPKG